MIRLTLLLTLSVAIAIGGCDYDPSTFNKKLNEMDSRITKLENAAPAKVIPPIPQTPTVMWVQNPGQYPRASAYFDSKYECAQVAATWGWPEDKKAKQTGTDPWITTSSRNDILVVSCLPQGVTPYAK